MFMEIRYLWMIDTVLVRKREPKRMGVNPSVAAIGHKMIVLTCEDLLPMHVIRPWLEIATSIPKEEEGHHVCRTLE